MQRRNTILLVDDVEMNRAILGGLFKDEYHILEAENGEQALLLLNEYHSSIAIMLLDIIMPVKDGYQVLEEIRGNGLLDEVPVIIITADNSVESELKAFDLGASDIIIKPFEAHVVRRRVHNTIELSLHKHNLESLVAEQARKLKETNEVLVDGLSSIIEYRSVETGQHIRRIRLLTKALLKEVNLNCPEYDLNDHKIDVIADASAMHDIGKIAIPDSVLNKPGRLTKDEFEIMKKHTVKGCEILESLDRMSDQEYLKYAYNICRYHHERWDGRGYPDGLIGDAIPICAQVTGIADAYDALASDRVYKKAISHEQAANMILNGECGMFSPKLLECFKSVLSQFAVLIQKYSDDSVTTVSSDKISLPPPKFQSSVLQMEQMKYHAVLRYINSTAIEIDFADGGYHIVYSANPELRNIYRGDSLEKIFDEFNHEIVWHEDIELLENIWKDEMPKFFAEGLLKKSWKYRIKSNSEKGYKWYEMTALRIDTEHPHLRKILMLWDELNKDTSEMYSVNEDDRKILGTIMNGICKCRNDKYFTVTYASDTFIGYTNEQLEARFQNRLINLIHADDRERVRKQLMSQLGDGACFEIEYRVLCPDGTYAWMLSRGETVFENGEEQIYCAIVDIEKSKKVEEELRLSLERYKIVLEQTNDIIFEWDIAQDKVIYSAKWIEKFGYTPIQDKASKLIPTISHLYPEDMLRFKDFIDEMSSGKKYGELAFRVANADGCYQWCKIRATAQFNGDGRPFRVVGIIVDINDDMIATQKLVDKTERDSLTNLYNKISAVRRVEQFLNKRNDDDNAAIFIIDVDDFKLVNDRYGHMFGDSVLSRISAQISSIFRGEDVIARIGGDEFLVMVCSSANDDYIETVASRIINCLKNASLDIPLDYNISCSVGVSRCPEDGTDFQTLFEKADMALYQAKFNGKNQFHQYNAATDGKYIGLNSAVPLRTSIDSDEYIANELNLNDLVPTVFYVLKNTPDLNIAINNVLELVGSRLNVSRTYIFENSDDGTYVQNTYEWCNDGIESRKDKLGYIYYDELKVPYKNHFNENGIFYCNDLSSLDEDSYEMLKPRKALTMLQCAMKINGKFAGWVGFDECVKNTIWTKEQIDVLLLTAEILSLFVCNKNINR